MGDDIFRPGNEVQIPSSVLATRIDRFVSSEFNKTGREIKESRPAMPAGPRILRQGRPGLPGWPGAGSGGSREIQ